MVWERAALEMREGSIVSRDCVNLIKLRSLYRQFLSTMGMAHLVQVFASSLNDEVGSRWTYHEYDLLKAKRVRFHVGRCRDVERIKVNHELRLRHLQSNTCHLTCWYSLVRFMLLPMSRKVLDFCISEFFY